MAPGFDVDVPSLRTGALRLSGDADDAAAAGGAASTAAGDAADAAAEGPLVQACRDLAERYTARTADVVTSARAASSALGTGADRYTADDAAAAQGLGAAFPAGPGAP